MARTGRPPKPVEHKRRIGNPGKRPLAKNVISILPQALEIPKAPKELGAEGKAFWNRAWSQAITWLSPDSDLNRVLQACRIADDLAVARARYRATTEPSDYRAVTAGDKALSEALSALGFDPVARSRLGLAEVKKIDALENVLHRREAAQQKKAN